MTVAATLSLPNLSSCCNISVSVLCLFLMVSWVGLQCVIVAFPDHTTSFLIYSKTCVEQPLSKRPKIGFQYQLLLNAGRKYCRMLQEEHSAILLTFIKLPFVIKIFVLSIFTQLLLYTGTLQKTEKWFSRHFIA